jgi:ATP-dependent Lhr-like helicase
VYDALVEHGASFFHDLLAVTSLLPAQLEDALSELATLGVVTADGFSLIRALVSPDRRRPDDARRRRTRRQRTQKAYARGGRWSRFPGAVRTIEPRERVEHWARQLLRRYGVMFRDLLARESCAPPWRELAGLYRRWEAQGTIRGGRFVSGVAGEQFALPEAVTHLRRKREEGETGEWLVVSASDPLNLAGVVTKGIRVPAIASHRLALRDGRLVASLQAGELRFHEQLPVDVAEAIARALRIDAAARQVNEPNVLSLPPAANTATPATRALVAR